MGYRSEVGIKCERRAFEMFSDIIRDYEFSPDLKQVERVPVESIFKREE